MEHIGGLSTELSYNTFSKEFVIALKGKRTYRVALGTDIYGNIIRLDNEIEKFSDNLSHSRERLKTLKAQLETAKVEAVKEFPQEQELAEKTARLGELNALLDVRKSDKVMLDEGEPEPERKNQEVVRKKKAIQEQFSCIDRLMDGADAIQISKEEHEMFLEYLALRNEMECRERELYYWCGHVYCYEYMKKIGALSDENE